MKMAKSELRQIIRECLREELGTTDHTENNLMASLDSAAKHKSNVLLHTLPRRSTVAKLCAWAASQRVHLAFINCASADAVAELNRIAEEAIPRTVLVLYQYDMARPATRARLLTAVSEKSCGQMFSIAVIFWNIYVKIVFFSLTS